MPRRWHAPHWWFPSALCIHFREGSWLDNTGNSYFGGLQFLRSTWYSVGGPYEAAFDHPGDPHYPFLASPREQLYRAYLVWDRDAGKPHDGIGSWREWGTASRCGVR